jgi:phospholipid/cholesterol/gamma-HCH transport system substrate-binding protein
MRSRTIREGSVGLLVLLGLGLFGGIVLWLRGFNPGNRSYRVTLEFTDARGLADVAGVQAGAAVRYRGITAGRVIESRTTPNAVEVEVEIAPATLVIPKQVAIEANQSGLIGETSIDIIPLVDVPPNLLSANPLAANCDRDQIICDGSRLEAQVGVSFKALITSAYRFTELFSNPQFLNEIRTLTRNSSNAAAGVTTLTGEVTTLSKSVRQELSNLSSSASASASSVGQAANQIGLTAAQVNELISANRTSLVDTLDNINQTSAQLQGVVNRLAPAIETGNLVENLQTLSANAALASDNLRNLTDTVGSSENVVILQQTLDSARATFQNAQKITADLDELTGDPAFRENLRNLVNNLSGLVSSTQQLQQQTDLARVLDPAIALDAQTSPASPATSGTNSATSGTNPGTNPKANSEADSGSNPETNSGAHSATHSAEKAQDSTPRPSSVTRFQNRSRATSVPSSPVPSSSVPSASPAPLLQLPDLQPILESLGQPEQAGQDSSR